jgi:hypothetical protein
MPLCPRLVRRMRTQTRLTPGWSLIRQLACRRTLREMTSMTSWTMAQRLGQADPRRDRLEHVVDVLLIGACEQPHDHRAPSQRPADQSAAPLPPCRSGHFPRGTALGAGPRIILRPPRDLHAMIVAARWCPGQAPPYPPPVFPYCYRDLARQSGPAPGPVSITTTSGEPGDTEPSAPRDALLYFRKLRASHSPDRTP